MTFRLVAIVAILLLIGLAAVSIEKRCLALRRARSLQEYQLEQLLERKARLRLEIERLTAPGRTETAEASSPARK